jgi:hypothetical protein
MKTNIFYQELGDKQAVLRQLKQPFQESTHFANFHKSQRLDSKQGVRIRNLAKNDKLLYTDLAKSTSQATEILTSRGNSLANRDQTSKMKKTVYFSRGFIVEGSPIRTGGIGTSASGQAQPENKRIKAEMDQSTCFNMRFRSDNSLKMSLDNLNTRGYELANMIENISNNLENTKMKRPICLPLRASIEKQASSSTTPSKKQLFDDDIGAKEPSKDSKMYRIITSRPSVKSPDHPTPPQPVTKKSPFNTPQKFLSQTRAVGFGKGSDWSHNHELQRHLQAKMHSIGPSNPLYYVEPA